MPSPDLSRRELLGSAAAASLTASLPRVSAAAGAAIQEGSSPMPAPQRQATPASSSSPNIVYFQVDNLGYGELGCYGGGVLRGADTARIDAFAKQGLQLLNFAPEAQCTPSRSALMTGRYAIRSGNHTVALTGTDGGLVTWERTIGDILSAAGYATACFGKWHIGTGEGRWPTDHGFDEWYGIPHSYDEALWLDDPWYDPDIVPPARILEAERGETPREGEILDLESRRDIDAEYLRRARRFLERSVAAERPFFLYFNHSMLHMPTIPRQEFAGASGNGEFADSLLELDADFGAILDWLDDLGVTDNTIVVFAGDNGPEETLLWRGNPGYWEGSYFTGMEGSLRTPCLIRYPGVVPPGRVSNEIVHITDMLPTLVPWAGAAAPGDRIIDGVDQRAFFAGEQPRSSREGFLYWLGPTLYGVKWRNFKLKLVAQTYATDPALPLPNPYIVNLITDPKERNPIDLPYLHSWVAGPTSQLLAAFAESTQREAPIPAGAPLAFVPGPAA